MYDRQNMKAVMEYAKKNLPLCFREFRLGDLGYFVADLESKTIHISNLIPNKYPAEFIRRTSKDFGQFCVDAQEVFQGDDLIKVIEMGLRVHQNFWAGTY